MHTAIIFLIYDIFIVIVCTRSAIDHSVHAGENPIWTVRCPDGLTRPTRSCVALSVPVSIPGVVAAPVHSSVLAVLQGNDVVHLLDVTKGTSFIQVRLSLLLHAF
jgi:hypothetical protein